MAGVSPATVYIYYDNKENMLQDIYREYAEDIYDYLSDRVNRNMGGPQLVEALIRSYYNYIVEHKEIYSFVEQFSSCPSLANQCSEEKNVCNIIFTLITEMKQNKVIKEYSEDLLLALMFCPVKAIVIDSRKSTAEKEALLQEMIDIIQYAILA
jgi:AcrR family transcriptional regulator